MIQACPTLPITASQILDTCPVAWIIRDKEGATVAFADNYPPPADALYEERTCPCGSDGNTITWCDVHFPA